MPEAQVEPVKPFFVASLLVFNEWFRQGYLPQHGVDLHLINSAKKEKKSLVELEGAQAQIRLMASLSEKEGVQALEGAISSLESGLTRDQITYRHPAQRRAPGRNLQRRCRPRRAQ